MTIEKKLKDIVVSSLHEHIPDLVSGIVKNELESKTLTTSQVEDIYNIDHKKQYRLRKDKKLTFIQDGRSILYYRKSIEKYLSEHTINGDY